MKAMIGFAKGMLSLKKPWVAWLGLLILANMVLPLVFIETLEAELVLAAFVVGAVFQMAIFHAKGFVRLLGVGHIFWVPLVYWLWTRLDPASLDSFFEYWMLSVVVLDSLSLIVDAVDVLRYVKGDRQPYVLIPS